MNQAKTPEAVMDKKECGCMECFHERHDLPTPSPDAPVGAGGEPVLESCWLIERGVKPDQDPSFGPFYFTNAMTWEQDALKAWRFKSEDEARKVCLLVCQSLSLKAIDANDQRVLFPRPEVRSHGFYVDARPTAPDAMPAEKCAACDEVLGPDNHYCGGFVSDAEVLALLNRIGTVVREVCQRCVIDQRCSDGKLISWDSNGRREGDCSCSCHHKPTRKGASRE